MWDTAKMWDAVKTYSLIAVVYVGGGVLALALLAYMVGMLEQ